MLMFVSNVRQLFAADDISLYITKVNPISRSICDFQILILTFRISLRTALSFIVLRTELGPSNLKYRGMKCFFPLIYAFRKNLIFLATRSLTLSQ